MKTKLATYSLALALTAIIIGSPDPGVPHRWVQDGCRIQGIFAASSFPN
jgi:hypothetical protein